MALKLNIELTFDDTVDEAVLAQGIAWLAKAGKAQIGTTVTEKVELTGLGVRPVTTVTTAQPSNGQDHGLRPAEMLPVGPEKINVAELADDIEVSEVEGDLDDISQQYAEAEAQVNASAGAQPAQPAAARRRGRKSNAEKAAEIAAALAAPSSDAAKQGEQQQQPLPQGLATVTTLPQASQLPAMTMPPGVSLPPGVTVAPFGPATAGTAPSTIAATQATAPAMPPAHQPAIVAAGTPMSLDDFRAVIAGVHKINPRHAFNYMRRPVWADGTHKDRWLLPDNVPEIYRSRVAAEMQATVNEATQ
jgi:hypothetical protein